MANPFENISRIIDINGEQYRYYDSSLLDESKFKELPFSIRILLESAIRNCDGFHVTKTDVESIFNWSSTKGKEDGSSVDVEISFKPSRVILQDFTGVPAVVDFAAMRDAVLRLGGNPDKINPICPSDLVIDHSVQVCVLIYIFFT